MKLRNLIIRITGISIIFILLAIILWSIAYSKSKENKYTYVLNGDFGKSSNCYVDNNDFRVCEIKKELVKVEMFYEED